MGKFMIMEHQKIVDGLQRRDKEYVSEVMKDHVSNQAVAVKNMIREQL